MPSLRNYTQKIVALVVAAAMIIAAGSAVAADTAVRKAATKPSHAAGPVITPVPLSKIKVFGDRPAPFALDARAAILIDARSGSVLYSYNAHERMQPASLAKMMTFYLTLQAIKQKRISLETKVPVSKKAWELALNNSLSRMFLQVGQQVPVEKLLYGLMVSSGSDAAVALAEYLGGSSAAFADEMNREAKKLGLTETHFENPDGLPEPGEYTTAADMAKLGRAIIQTFPQATVFTSAKDFTYDKIRQPNFNSLLFYDPRVDGIKTGHVEEAGYHLVACAHSHHLELISAVLGTPSAYRRRTETEKLLDWAFRTFTTVSPDWRKAVPPTVRVYQGNIEEVPIAPATGTPYFTVGLGEAKKVALSADYTKQPLVAPLPKGAVVGQLTITIAGKTESSIPLITQVAVQRGGLIHNLADWVRMRV